MAALSHDEAARALAAMSAEDQDRLLGYLGHDNDAALGPDERDVVVALPWWREEICSRVPAESLNLLREADERAARRRWPGVDAMVVDAQADTGDPLETLAALDSLLQALRAVIPRVAAARQQALLGGRQALLDAGDTTDNGLPASRRLADILHVSTARVRVLVNEARASGSVPPRRLREADQLARRRWPAVDAMGADAQADTGSPFETLAALDSLLRALQAAVPSVAASRKTALLVARQFLLDDTTTYNGAASRRLADILHVSTARVRVLVNEARAGGSVPLRWQDEPKSRARRRGRP
ncbi:MAG: hypothetical protein JO086_12095 [Acidimicrobiia bacterium]|nr:hypothetical protein [Acidimicrobiia bacterium]